MLHGYITNMSILRSSSHLDLSRFEHGQAVIKNADMAEDMQQDAIDCATQVGHSMTRHSMAQAD